MKVCSKCNQEKAKTFFGKSATRKDGLRPWCKTCHNKANAVWRANNKAYYTSQNNKRKELRKKYDATYKEKNPKYSAKYYYENKADFIGRVSKRRQKAKYATPLWADKNKMRLVYRLSSNLNKLHGFVKYHVDHIVPLQGKEVSGLHVHNNLQILKAQANKTKFNKWKL